MSTSLEILKDWATSMAETDQDTAARPLWTQIAREVGAYLGGGIEPEPLEQQLDFGVCRGFQWIGQSFAYCDRCGRPYWEHEFDEQYAAPFVEPTYVRISPEKAASCKAKWGGAS